jgi:hypothetical protein
MSAPVLGAQAIASEDEPWSVAVSWRYQKSDRHFRGSVEEPTREQGGATINWVNQFEVALTRSFSPRFNLTVGLPYLMAERSTPIRDPFQPDDIYGNDPVVMRSETQSRGIGDLSVVHRRWMLDPATHPRYNVALGLGVKLPTGAENVYDERTIRDTTPSPPNTFQTETVVQNVDQSIQPGDGGVGAILDLQAFARFADNRAAAWATGTYLANPRNTNGVPTYLDSPGEEVMSVVDQYLYRAGLTWFPTRRVGLSLGGRMEGVPTEDLFGDSEGFRRPGYAFSLEPGFSYTRGSNTVSLMVPWAIHRNRKPSLPEIENGQPGDAAFADYLILAGYIRRF